MPKMTSATGSTALRHAAATSPPRPLPQLPPCRVAIIGSGPSAFYAADSLLKRANLSVEVDMYDRLPTPFGLVRSGVRSEEHTSELQSL